MIDSTYNYYYFMHLFSVFHFSFLFSVLSLSVILLFNGIICGSNVFYLHVHSFTPSVALGMKTSHISLHGHNVLSLCTHHYGAYTVLVLLTYAERELFLQFIFIVNVKPSFLESIYCYHFIKFHHLRTADCHQDNVPAISIVCFTFIMFSGFER